ncbi:MAG: DUF192 domain-containing protein [Chloroflexi bacterium]|nr:DUF192 domain-containing protein [Chloroflexota bacterium]
MKIPNLKLNTTFLIFVTVASIALITARSTDEPEPFVPETITPPWLGAFIESDDCVDLQYGHLGLAEVTISLGDLDITVFPEVADEPNERMQGLMCRESIPAGSGMFFYYPAPRNSGFWMYNTYVSIDILHINRSHQVVDKITMTPCLRDGLSDDDWQVKCETEAVDYLPSGEWIWALELPAGWLDSQGISNADIGDLKIAWVAVAD